MSINYNSLPSEKPAFGQIIPKGHYLGTIKKAEMRQGKQENKPPYLNLELDITDPISRTAMGKMWVILTESESPLPRYQLSRFITALNLPIQGEFDLKDLTKMVINKQLELDITPEERNDGKPPQRSVVDINAGEIFYPVNPTDTIDPASVFTPPSEESTQVMSSY